MHTAFALLLDDTERTHETDTFISVTMTARRYNCWCSKTGITMEGGTSFSDQIQGSQHRSAMFVAAYSHDDELCTLVRVGNKRHSGEHANLDLNLSFDVHEQEM